MVKGHAKGPRSLWGNTPRIQRGKMRGVPVRSSGDKSTVGGEVRPLRLRVEPFGSCRINGKGYPRINSGEHKDKYLHRAIWEVIAGKEIPKGFTIHHMNGKLCWCGSNLVALGPGLHVTPLIRHPYTGRIMTKDEYVWEFGDA